jgi:hypothetical protein
MLTATGWLWTHWSPTVAEMRYSRIVWAGIVLVMEDGSKRAMEFHHPHTADLTFTRDHVYTFEDLARRYYGEPEVEIRIAGRGARWHYGEGATPPPGPARAITTGPLEIEGA